MIAFIAIAKSTIVAADDLITKNLFRKTSSCPLRFACRHPYPSRGRNEDGVSLWTDKTLESDDNKSVLPHSRVDIFLMGILCGF